MAFRPRAKAHTSGYRSRVTEARRRATALATSEHDRSCVGALRDQGLDFFAKRGQCCDRPHLDVTPSITPVVDR